MRRTGLHDVAYFASLGALRERVSKMASLAAGDAEVLLPLLNGGLHALLRELVIDPEALAVVAGRSYRHPNGFDKIVLCSTTKREPELRLHIWWPAGDPSGGEHIHNHPWYFRSVVLSGALESSFFEIADRGTRYLHYRFGPPARDGDDGYRISPVGQQFLQPVFDGRVAAGTVYGLAPSVLHRARGARALLTATLVLQGPFVTEPSDVYVTDPLPPVADAGVRYFTPDELERMLARYIEVCPAQRA